MISDALRIGQAQQGIEQKKLTDVVDTMYKGALIQEIENRGEVSKINAQTELAKQMRRAPLEVPGIGKLDFEEWKSLDTKTKAYSYYAFDAKQNSEQVMPYNEWSEQTNDPMALQIYREALEDPGFAKWYGEDYRPGVTVNIGDQVAKADALGKVKNRLYFTDPKGLSVDLDRHMNSDEVKDAMFQAQMSGEPNAVERMTSNMAEKFIEGRIKSASGNVLDKRLDGRDFVWTVKWSDGTTSEVRHAN